jgi:hypothetical protein
MVSLTVLVTVAGGGPDTNEVNVSDMVVVSVKLSVSVTV